jgi:hypothetical protein
MGRELVPVQTALLRRRSSPSRGELMRVLRGLRALCFARSPVPHDAMRAYDISRALATSRVSHRIDLRL